MEESYIFLKSEARGQAVKSEDRRTYRIRNLEDNRTIDIKEQRTSGPRGVELQQT
jgi:hypothetical protein